MKLFLMLLLIGSLAACEGLEQDDMASRFEGDLSHLEPVAETEGYAYTLSFGFTIDAGEAFEEWGFDDESIHLDVETTVEALEDSTQRHFVISYDGFEEDATREWWLEEKEEGYLFIFDSQKTIRFLNSMIEAEMDTEDAFDIDEERTRLEIDKDELEYISEQTGIDEATLLSPFQRHIDLEHLDVESELIEHDDMYETRFTIDTERLEAMIQGSLSDLEERYGLDIDISWLDAEEGEASLDVSIFHGNDGLKDLEDVDVDTHEEHFLGDLAKASLEFKLTDTEGVTLPEATVDGNRVFDEMARVNFAENAKHVLEQVETLYEDGKLDDGEVLLHELKGDIMKVPPVFAGHSVIDVGEQVEGDFKYPDSAFLPTVVVSIFDDAIALESLEASFTEPLVREDILVIIEHIDEDNYSPTYWLIPALRGNDMIIY